MPPKSGYFERLPPDDFPDLLLLEALFEARVGSGFDSIFVSLFGSDFDSGFASDFASLFVSDFDSLFVSEGFSLPEDSALPSPLLDSDAASLLLLPARL